MRVVGDKDYASRNIRSYLCKRGIACTIPEGVDQISGRLRRGESLCRLDREGYRRRNVARRGLSGRAGPVGPGAGTGPESHAQAYGVEGAITAVA
ncbi:transposase IS4 protein [Streptomyces sp. Mg1]|nr:transposase IS4 protein [Streptomyces sp. Mg1]